MDVGLWVGKHLHKLCDVAEESFSLEDFPEYAAYVDPRATVQVQDNPQVQSCQKTPKKQLYYYCKLT